MINLFLSPGHFESTWERDGAKGIKPKGEPKFEEFDFNIAVVDELHERLKKYPQFKIHQLEHDNGKQDMTLTQRISYINQNTKSIKDMVVSVHANYSKNVNASGQWGFCGSNSGKEFLDIFSRNCHNAPIPYTRSFKCKFNHWSEFGIVLRTKPIAILLEHGFFSNKKERALLRTETYQKYCASTILKSILTYYGIKKKETENIDTMELMKQRIREKTDYPEKWITAIAEAVKMAKSQRSDLGTFEVFKHLDDFVLKMTGDL